MNGLESGSDIIHQSIILGKVDARDIPGLFGIPTCYPANKVDHRRKGNANLPFLLIRRLGERNGVGGILFTGTDAELLLFVQIEELDMGRIAQLRCGLMVELDVVPGNGRHGGRSGLHQVDYGEFFKHCNYSFSVMKFGSLSNSSGRNSPLEAGVGNRASRCKNEF